MGTNDIRVALGRQDHGEHPVDAHSMSTQSITEPPNIRAVPWQQITREAVGVFVVTRLAYAIATYFIVAFSIGSVTGNHAPPSMAVVLRAWQTGDVHNYLAIASHGYTQSFLTAFFPLYPLLIHIFSFGQTGTVELAVAMLISNLGALAALIGLGLLAAQEYGPLTSMPAIRALISFPLAFFLVMGYADVPFLALVIFSFYFARRQRWGKAIACIFVSALLRPTAVTLALPLFWEYGRQQGWWSALWGNVQQRRIALGTLARKARGQSSVTWIGYPLLLLVAAPAGIAIFAVYCQVTFGDALVFLHVQQSHFYRHPTPLPSALLLLLRTLLGRSPASFLEARNLIDVAPLVIFLGLVAFACIRRQMPVMYLLYVVGVFYSDLAAPMVGREIPLPSVGRHMLLAVPVFLLLGKWSAKRPWLDTLIISLGLMLQGVFLVAVMHGNLVGFNAID